MKFHQLIQNALHLDGELGQSLLAFRPELIICATIVALLIVRMLAPGRQTNAFYVTLIGSAVALWMSAPWQYLSPGGLEHSQQIFSGMLVFDTFSVYMRALLFFFVLLLAAFTQISGIPDRRDATDFYVLVLGAVLGMCLMVSANHMLIVFLGIEMASVPSYVLAGFLRQQRRGSEAALKYAVYGAAAAGIMLYGISLLVGVLGSAHLPTMATQLAEMLRDPAVGGSRHLVLVLGGLMVAVGLAFKLSAVPFHFWAPDVFEGASAEVAAFLSIASKAAALALLVRVGLGLGTSVDAADLAALEPARQYIVGLIALLAAVTCTFGNLAAYGQTNIKRMLAYSTIAHAGYLMMPVAAAVALAGYDPAAARSAVGSMAFYLGIYLFMNLGAFASVAFLRNALDSEQIDDYAGLIRVSPGLAICFSIVLFSLVGLPPLAGFAAKFAIFAYVYKAGLLALLAIGVLNTVLSLFYYLRVVKVMVMADDAETPPAGVPMASIPGAFCLIVTLPIVVLGVWWNGLFVWAQAAASQLL